jgi:allantoinase
MLYKYFLYRNSIPPTTTKKNLETKMIAAKGKTHVDVAFWGGVVPGNQVSCVHNMHFTA